MWRYREASTWPDRSAPPNVPQSKHELLQHIRRFGTHQHERHAAAGRGKRRID